MIISTFQTILHYSEEAYYSKNTEVVVDAQFINTLLFLQTLKSNVGIQMKFEHIVSRVGTSRMYVQCKYVHILCIYVCKYLCRSNSHA